MYASQKTLGLLSACMLCIRLAVPDAMAATVPVAESFESYSANHLITDEADWSGASSAAGVVSTDATAINALTTYTNEGGVFPLPSATHDQVLAVTDSLTNTVSSASGGVVITEWLVMPTLRDAADSTGSDNYQTAFYFNSDTNIVIWRRDLAPTPTNDWLELANTPTIDLAKWMRVTLTLDYATDRYQLAIDGTPISDAEGEQRDTSPNGTWFNMVQTNGAMARFRADAGDVTYLDDLVFTNRSASYSGTLFAEAGANDGSIATTETITLVGDTFVNPLNASHVSAVGLTNGLSVSITRISDTTADLTFSGNADGPHTSDTTVNFSFLDTAFTLGSAASVVGAADTLTLDFHDGLGIDWGIASFAEDTPNNGTIGNQIALALVGDTFVDDGAFNAGDEYTITAGSVPAGLTLSIAYVDPTSVTLSLTGAASSHDGGSGGFTLTFNNAAFGGNDASAVPNSAQALTVNYLTQPSIGYSGALFAEASNNDGSIGNQVTATLTGDTLTGGARALGLGVDYSITSGAVPSGLALSITSDGSTGLTLSLGLSASPHTSSANGSFEVTFTDALFANVAAADISGTSPSLSVTFDDPPVITYSGTVFSELAGGVIDNSSPIEITISGDTFTGANGSDFVADGKVTTNNIPDGLTLTLIKSSATKLLASLTGAATAHSDGDDVNDLTIVFEDTAIATADADQVTGYSNTGLDVDFNNNTLAINSTPYSESFESYADGDGLGNILGWQPHGSPVVTSETAIVNALNSDFTEFPLTTTRDQVLRMTEETTVEILSPSGGDLYTDAMLYVTAREDAPVGSTDHRLAFYVNTNEVLVLWHDPGTGGEWLETATTVTTGAWHRVTLQQDQTNKRYQLYLDGSIFAIGDAGGYAKRTGATTSGSWFGMVNQSGFMSRVRVQGGDTQVPAYLDELVVSQTQPGHLGVTIMTFQ